MVEHHLAKVGVASSSLVFRSIICGNSSVVEHHLAKVGVASSSLVFRSIVCKSFRQFGPIAQLVRATGS